ncbi:hypothetical protein LUZ61_000325 [Rhynchospora tenuis]|uniref:Uncharacterized protein n=1 Tax=Rhynchospora tenuis TaxID=198213 RepID=A0AAD5ZEU2_9POAL|nr:hypothetical protein LUZ61_000325 [Rhynchospora tenuis]
MANTRLDDKVAIITGAASGIGEATARLFASHGATVVIADIQDELGAALAASIGADKCRYVHCAVTDEAQVESAVRYAVSEHGRLDIIGTAAALKHAGRAMVAAGIRGSIICTVSVGACQAGHGPAGYVTSKHAILGLVRAAAADLGWHVIRVKCVSPFGVATPLLCGLAGINPEKMEQVNAVMCNLKGLVLKASHVASAALFLASASLN